MKIIMSGLEHFLAALELRERLSFTKSQVSEIVKKIKANPEVTGCVLISTCNRTELYLSCEKPENPGNLLCQAAGMEYAPYEACFVTREGEQAVRHLMEVSAGLQSRIWGEDQIISQVKSAIAVAREAGASDPVLETLFRWAVSAGKEVRSQVHLTEVPSSAASMAVSLLEQKLGTLQGKRAVVIGNGEMGRLSARLLQQSGCQVAVTLRTYRHGETIVPPGCGVVPYEERFSHMDGADILVSATTSPHYTVTAEKMAELSRPPHILVDLAVPRDIQPEIGALPGISLYNIDDLGDFSGGRAVPPEVEQILQAHTDRFYRWHNYKTCMSSVGSLKQAIVDRLLLSQTLEGAKTEEEWMELTVDKTVELLISGLAERITSEDLSKCESKIRLHTHKS